MKMGIIAAGKGERLAQRGVITPKPLIPRAPDIFAEIARARKKKLNALRRFLGHLVDEGYPIHGVPVPKTIDVDYPEDIEKAEAYLKEINEG